MEAVVGNQRVYGNTIERYCHFTQKNHAASLRKSEKREIVENRMRELNRTEWQRWVPGFGFFRILSDVVKKDNMLLEEMHRTVYNTINLIYNPSILVGAVALGEYLFR